MTGLKKLRRLHLMNGRYSLSNMPAIVRTYAYPYYEKASILQKA